MRERHHDGTNSDGSPRPLLVAAVSTMAMAQTFSALRGATPLDQEGQPPPMTPE